MVTQTVNLSANQNMGQSAESCDAGPVLWSEQRTCATGTIQYKIRDINAQEIWGTATFTMWLCTVAGNILRGPVSVTKQWNVDTPWVSFGTVTGTTFRLRTQIRMTEPDGWPMPCRWGSWKGNIRFQI